MSMANRSDRCGDVPLTCLAFYAAVLNRLAPHA